MPPNAPVELREALLAVIISADCKTFSRQKHSAFSGDLNGTQDFYKPINTIKYDGE